MAPKRSSHFQPAAVTTADDASETYMSGWRLGTVILSLFFASFLIALDTNIINTAVPQITSDFHALSDGAWYGAAYLVTLTVFQPLYGSFYKYFDKVNVYRTAIVVFETGSVLCAVAPNSATFITGRAVAGMGAAGVLQGALSIICHVVPLEKRPMYMGITTSVFAITAGVGPPLGGVFTQHATWRWCFWINLPLGGAVLAMAFVFLRIRKVTNRTLTLRQKVANMDPIGCIVFIGSMCCLLLALQWGGQTKPWDSPAIIILFVASGVLLVVFGALQWWLGERALIPLRVLGRRNIIATAGMLFFIGGSTFLNTFYMPFYFQAVRGVEPIASGVNFIAFLMPHIVVLVIVAALVRVWGWYLVYMIVGELVCIVGTAFLTKLDLHTPTVQWAAWLVIAGTGVGMSMQLPYTLVQLTLDDDDVPTGNAIAVLFQQLGGAIAIPLGQAIEITTLLHDLPIKLPQIPPKAVLTAGAMGLKQLAPTPEALEILRTIWNTAVARTMILSVAFVAATVPFTLLMQWMDVNKVAKEKELASSRSTRDLLRAAEDGSLHSDAVSMRSFETGCSSSQEKNKQTPPPSAHGEEVLKWQWVDGEWVV